MGLYIPPEIVVNILSRLPNESLRQCRLVCKTWLNLMVYDPSFTRMHIQHCRRQKLYNDHVSSGEISFIFVIQENIGYKKFYYAGYNSNDEKLMKVADMDITHTFDSSLYSSALLPCTSTSYRIVGSCDGLICIALDVVMSDYETYVNRMYICNPMTRECLIVPQLDNGEYDSSLFGFGYDPSTNEYKVIGFIYTDEKVGSIYAYQAYVYTVGSGNEWRNIGSISTSFFWSFNAGNKSCRTVFLDGALIWVDNYGSILSFDLADEKLHLLPLAPCFEEFLDDWGPENYHCSYELRVLGDCLCIVLQDGVLYDFWLFKKKKNEADQYIANCDKKEQKYQSWSWTHEFTFHWNHRGHLWDIAKPFAVTMDGEILFHNEQAFYLHDFDNETTYPLVDFDQIRGQPSIVLYDDYVKNCIIQEAIPHVNSFVSLKALGEKDTIMIKSNETSPELKSIVPELNYG